MNISERIIDLIKEKGISQKEFSKLTGIPESTVSDWKKKGNTPKSESLLTICRVLDISLYELLADDEADRTEYTVDYNLSEDELKLIKCFRHSDEESKRTLLAYLERISNKPFNMPAVGARKPGEIIQFQSEKADTELLIQKQLARRLRKLARLDRIRLDESEHISGLNLHLYRYLDYLGMDKLEYVRHYLANIQPFMLSEIRSQEKFDNAVCVLDRFYRISVYIKVDATRGEEVVVSFHENNKNGIAKKNPIIKSETLVYVFADSIGSHVKESDKYSINLFLTRGVRTFPINVPATRYDEDGFLVRYTYINNALIDIVNGYLEDLYAADLDMNDISVFSSLQQLSFTSYGNDVFSNISLLTDSLLIQRDALGRQTADAALVIYCNSIEMNEPDRQELINTLEERFRVNSDRMLPGIIRRIEENL